MKYLAQDYKTMKWQNQVSSPGVADLNPSLSPPYFTVLPDRWTSSASSITPGDDEFTFLEWSPFKY